MPDNEKISAWLRNRARPWRPHSRHHVNNKILTTAKNAIYKRFSYIGNKYDKLIRINNSISCIYPFSTFQDAIESHKNSLTFASKKKLQLAPEKCYIMLLNNANKTGTVHRLEMDGGFVKEVQSTGYLGSAGYQLGYRVGQIDFPAVKMSWPRRKTDQKKSWTRLKSRPKINCIKWNLVKKVMTPSQNRSKKVMTPL